MSTHYHNTKQIIETQATCQNDITRNKQVFITFKSLYTHCKHNVFFHTIEFFEISKISIIIIIKSNTKSNKNKKKIKKRITHNSIQDDEHELDFGFLGIILIT